MKNITLSLTALTLVLGAPAFAAEKESYKSEVKVERDAQGNYERNVSQEAVDATGTKVTKDVSTDVDVDSDGTKETTVKTKTTRDPKGLMNKDTVKTTDKVRQENGQTVSTHKKTVNGETVEDVKRAH